MPETTSGGHPIFDQGEALRKRQLDKAFKSEGLPLANASEFDDEEREQVSAELINELRRDERYYRIIGDAELDQATPEQVSALLFRYAEAV